MLWFLGGHMNNSKRICFHSNMELKQILKPWKMPSNGTIAFWLALLKQPSCSLIKRHLQQQILQLKISWLKRHLNLRTFLALQKNMRLSRVALAMFKLKLQLGQQIFFFFSKSCFHSLKYFWWLQTWEEEICWSLQD